MPTRDAQPLTFGEGVLLQAHTTQTIVCMTGSTGAGCGCDGGWGCFQLMPRGVSQNICRGQRAQLCFPSLPFNPQSQPAHQSGARSFKMPSEIKQGSKIHIPAMIPNCCACTKTSPGINPCPGFPSCTQHSSYGLIIHLNHEFHPLWC